MQDDILMTIRKEYLAAIDYEFQEDLFTYKIGTFDDLESLIKAGIIKKTEKGFKIGQEYMNKLKASVSNKDLMEKHSQLIAYYQKKYIQAYRYDYEKKQPFQLHTGIENSEDIHDFKHFTKNYNIDVGLYRHLCLIGEKDKAMLVLCGIAGKMVNWGKMDQLLEMLRGFTIDGVKKEYYLWAIYFRVFAMLKTYAGKNFDHIEMKQLLNELETEVRCDIPLYVECLNLKGEYIWRILKDLNGAESVFKQALEQLDIYKRGNALAETEIQNAYEIIEAKILLNMGLCFYENKKSKEGRHSLKATAKLLERAGNKYELYKFYATRLVVYGLEEEPDEDFSTAVEQINDYMEKKQYFPDVERTFFNNYAWLCIHRMKSIEDYFGFKCRVLYRDLLLYKDYFRQDLEDILCLIAVEFVERRDKWEQIAGAINEVVDFLGSVGLKNEKVFFECVRSYLLGKDSDSFKNIEKKWLISLYEEFKTRMNIGKK